jgi:hypothetical protein
LGRPWTVDVGKKSAAMGERAVGGEAQPKSVMGVDVRLEAAGEEVAGVGMVAVGVTAGTREAAGAEEAARAEVMADAEVAAGRPRRAV